MPIKRSKRRKIHIGHIKPKNPYSSKITVKKSYHSMYKGFKIYRIRSSKYAYGGIVWYLANKGSKSIKADTLKELKEKISRQGNIL